MCEERSLCCDFLGHKDGNVFFSLQCFEEPKFASNWPTFTVIMAKHDFSRTKVSWLPQFISLCHVEMAREKKRNSAEKEWLLSFNCRFEKNQADQSLWRFTFPKTQQVRSLSFCGGTSNSSSKSAGLSPELIIGALLSCGSPHGKWKNPLLWKVGGILQTKDGLSCFPQAARQLGDFEDFRCSFWKQKWPMFKG